MIEPEGNSQKFKRNLVRALCSGIEMKPFGLKSNTLFQESGACHFPRGHSFWWLSRNFVEAFASWSQLSDAGLVDPDQLKGIASDPKFALFHWLATVPDFERNQAMIAFESGSDAIIERILERSALAKDANFAMRLRAYAANLLLSESSRIIAIADATNTSWLQPGQLDGSKIRRLAREVPAYHVETELAVRIEAMNRPLKHNDLGDMRGYVSSVPYADVVIGENLFVNLAKQAGLGKKYGCVLSTDIFSLDQIL